MNAENAIVSLFIIPGIEGKCHYLKQHFRALAKLITTLFMQRPQDWDISQLDSLSDIFEYTRYVSCCFTQYQIKLEGGLERGLSKAYSFHNTGGIHYPQNFLSKPVVMSLSITKPARAHFQNGLSQGYSNRCLYCGAHLKQPITSCQHQL